MATGAALACLLLLLSLSAASGKYVYVPTRMRWVEAQSHCRECHTDLAPVSGRYDMRKIAELLPDPNAAVWIGLERNNSEWETWLWSGGGKVLKSFWRDTSPRQPNDWNQPEDKGLTKGNEWWDYQGIYHFSSVCFQATVVREPKTWEGALEHCREHHRDLASVASDTEMLLIQKELEENGTTQGVWTGLRMLPDDWMWVDRQPLEYQAWGAQGRPACPTVRRCGGLRRKTVETSVDEPKWEWEAYGCEQKFHFVCY